MTRGRKKGGLKINDMNEKTQLVDMIINQANSLNKKIKGFKNKNIDEFEEYIKTILTNDLVKWNKSGSISKSKKFYEKKSMLWLKKTMSGLHKMNNHDFYGTVNKYSKAMTTKLVAVKEYTRNHMEKMGFDEKYILEVTNSKNYYTQLFLAYGEKKGNKLFDSNQAIDKIILDYKADTGLSESEMNKLLADVETKDLVTKRLNDEEEAYQLFEKLYNKPKR